MDTSLDLQNCHPDLGELQALSDLSGEHQVIPDDRLLVNRSLSFSDPLKRSKKARKRGGSLKKSGKRIEDLDRSLSISLEELLQGVNASKSPPLGKDEPPDFSSPQTTSDCSSNREILEDFSENISYEVSDIIKNGSFGSQRSAIPNNSNIENDLNIVEDPCYPTSPIVQPNDNLASADVIVTDETLGNIEAQSSTGGLMVSEDDEKQNMPSGDAKIAEDASENPVTKNNEPCNKKYADELNAPPSTLDVTPRTEFYTDSDTSPTSLEVKDILQYVAEDDHHAEAQIFDSNEQNKDAFSEDHAATSDMKAISKNTDCSSSLECCNELSTLTLEPGSDELEMKADFVNENGKLKLSRPRCAKEIQKDVLYSELVTYPGCYDNDRRPVLFIHCESIDERKIGKIEIARLMLYLISSSSYVTLVVHLVDEGNWKVVSQAITLFQENRPGVISRMILMARNPDFHCEIDNFQPEHDIIHSVDDLRTFIADESLPESLGGNLKYNHKEWVQQRLDVESYVLLCERLRHNFASNTVAMTTATLPTTLHDTTEALNKHRSTMTELLDDQSVRDLHDTGHRFLTKLNTMEKSENRGYSEQIQLSYESVCSAIQRYVQAADERLLALEKHLLVKQFEESCDRILSWASDRSDELHEKFGEVADSLIELRIQRQEFDRFYLEVVKQYAQCDCLLSEANQLSSSGFLGQVNSQARNAAERISQVVQDMETKKEEVERASQLYLFVDQAYSWALAGMRFVASLSMSEKMTTEELRDQIEKYDEYMSNHPPIPKDDFIRMQKIALQFSNTKCQRQCEVAQQKCAETKDLFIKRRKLLVKARERQIQELRKKEEKVAPELKDSEVIQNCTENNNITKHSDSSEKSEDSPKKEKPRELLRQSSDVSHRLNRVNGYNNNNNGGAPIPNGPGESVPAKHRPKKMLRKSASMSAPHMRPKIGAPMRGEEQDTQGRTRWSLAIEELIRTEAEYVRSLNYIIEHYYPMMNQLDDVPQALRGKRGVIFGNIENICDFHTGQFLDALRECHDQPGRVAEVFIQHREGFGTYALYSKNKPRSDDLMREHGTKFFRSKQLSLRDKMDLASYLLKPVQRMGKYALLLHNIAKHSDVQHRSLLREAEALVKFQLRHGNDLLAMDSIVNCDVNLKEQGDLIRQDEFLIFHGRRKYLRHIFLFDDLLLLSKPQKVHGGLDVYHYKSSYKTSEIGLTENIGETGLKFEIRFRRPMQDSIIFNSTNDQKKQAWVDDIRNMLWKQALRNKANRLNEMVNMGVGSKPHLDIRSSKSPITDRSVATERLMGGRVLPSRSRASIAVSTFDHACKRPHSTVSTSSTSSNGSFQHSHQPASVFDFRAILEGEEYDSGSGQGSSICMSSGDPDGQENTEVSEASSDSLPQQFITTV